MTWGLPLMHPISMKPLRDFWPQHPDSEKPLRAWYRVVQHAEWKNFADVRKVYASASQVGKFTVFDIGGNKYRLIAVIHYDRGRVYVRHVLTHKDYDLERWKNE